MGLFWLIGRLILGIYFLMTGFNHLKNYQGMKQACEQKNLPLPGACASLSGLILIIGGLTILTGMFVGIGVLLLVIFLIIAATTFHNYWVFEDPMQKMGEQTQFMKNIALAAALLMLLQIQDWSWTL
ncbi:Uncharacterized membrane protein YphA, DoxX/SURF4 family [Salinibacillus kushneri]|uniref:Uncharacterized membrane protein YphA, DoxX/SURF4 family n=1 Tax=Salinibacillus kushneri TaxID=237682 RepID=A0A1I0AFE6_9BACI|nr:DoxX family protein [Salinibacillus kushneri]SES92873.1 Uncharacterized membrane protein YphA, DoxX/SURF4 family [Salinibacillus kushneri]